MRNLKKILALVLAMVMTFSVMATANAFTDDAQIDDTYAEAVDVLAALEVFEGYEDGSFDPKGDITRAEVAAIIYRVVTGDVDDEQAALYAGAAKFADAIPAWAAGYVGYCANAGYIKGYEDGTFRPAGKVTGFEALAMILRAVGYDKMNEFTGAEWSLNVAKIAKELHITDNVKPGVLVGAATREVVAEILFQAINVPQVTYTAAFGYQNQTSEIFGVLNDTIGEETFGLEYIGVSADDFGRPGDLWFAYGKKLVFLPYAPVYSTNVKVDECEIAHAIGLSKTAAIEKSFIDGVPASVDNDGKLNPLATTSYIGAQGCLTEVYYMGAAGYRVVEINTYLASVTKVTPAYTDKNGHTTKATVNVAVYAADADNATDFNLTVVADGYSVGDYVLVTISWPGYDAAEAQSIEAAPVIAGGSLTGWTNGYADVAATHVVGTTTYSDAAKFELNYRIPGVYSVITDTYGNVIGLATVATNYVVIEKIEWKHNTAGIGGGYALADLVLIDGSKVAGATIATVNAVPATNMRTDVTGVAAKAYVADSYVNNANYYNHIWTYTVNENGSYNLAQIEKHDASTTDYIYDIASDATYTQGNATIAGKTNDVVATSNTVFLYKNLTGDTYAYTVYVGKENAPSFVEGTICAKLNSDGYAKLVVVSDYELKDSSFLAYVTDETVDTASALGLGYYVFKAGSTEATTVYDPNGILAAAWTETGLYTIKVNTLNQVTSAEIEVRDLTKTDSYTNSAEYHENLYWNRVQIDAKESATSIQTEKFSGLTAANNGNGYTTTAGDAWKDFNTVETTVIKVTKTALDGTATLAAGTMADVVKGDVIVVGWTGNSAKVIYVFSSGYKAPVVSTYAWEYKNATMDSVTGAEIEIALVKDGKTVQALKSAKNLTVTVAVYNEAGTLVYSTTVAADVNANGNLLVEAPHTLSAGDEYMAIVTISGSSYVDGVQDVKTPYIEAQTTTAQPEK